MKNGLLKLGTALTLVSGFAYIATSCGEEIAKSVCVEKSEVLKSLMSYDGASVEISENIHNIYPNSQVSYYTNIESLPQEVTAGGHIVFEATKLYIIFKKEDGTECQYEFDLNATNNTISDYDNSTVRQHNTDGTFTDYELR